MLWLLLLGPADAARLDVVNNPNGPSEYASLAEAVEAAAAGDKIFIEAGEFLIEQQIVVDKDLEIRGHIELGNANNPNGEGPDEDTKLVISYAAVDTQSDGLFVIDGATVTVSDIFMKGLEWACGDQWDNDGNGLKDKKDPYCESLNAGSDSADTAIVSESPAGADFRPFKVTGGATATFERMYVQGFGYAINGGAMSIKGSSSVLVDNSLFVHNESVAIFDSNGWVSEALGGVFFVKNSELTVTNSDLWRNRAVKGGTVYAEGSVITLSDNIFWENYGTDASVLWAGDQSNVYLRRNFVSGNVSNLVPQTSVNFWPSHSGALEIQDSLLDAQNNVFNHNESLDWGSAIYLLRGLPLDPQPPVQPPGYASNQVVYEPHIIQNNTFVNNVANLNGGTVRVDAGRIEWRNNIAAYNVGGVLNADDFPDLYWDSGKYNLYYVNDALTAYHAGELAVFPTDVTTNVIEQDPVFLDFIPDSMSDPDLWSFVLDPLFSPGIDAGDPNIFDPGGTRSDIGYTGGPDGPGTDYDGDGWEQIYDCDDTNIAVYPGAVEDCDGIDNDCNGTVDDLVIAFYPDNDGDGYGDLTQIAEEACPDEVGNLPPGNWVANNVDCDDTNAGANPYAEEICDGIDNDCDGETDEDLAVRPQYPDLDGDGFGDESQPGNIILASCPGNNRTPLGGDCDDNNALIHPLITTDAWIVSALAGEFEYSEASRSPDFVADGIDQDCDGGDLCYADNDGDGYGRIPESDRDYYGDNDLICANASAPTSPRGGDCDDYDLNANPDAAEVAGDGLDQDCDGVEVCFVDEDGDGYGDAERTIKDDDLDCSNVNVTATTTADNTDCDDERFDVNPAAEETCDGVDNDCDGELDEVVTPADIPNLRIYYVDADGDGYGDAAQSVEACGQPDGYATEAFDCDDEEPSVFPGADEICDELDNNCNNAVDEPELAVDITYWLPDNDADGYGDATNPALIVASCEPPDVGAYVPQGASAPDCDDTSALTGPCVSCDGCASSSRPASLVSMMLLLGVGYFRRRR